MIQDLKVTNQLNTKKVQSLSNYPSRDGVTAEQLKKFFDWPEQFIEQFYNPLIDQLTSTGLAEQLHVAGVGGVKSQTLQQALQTIYEKMVNHNSDNAKHIRIENNRLQVSPNGSDWVYITPDISLYMEKSEFVSEEDPKAVNLAMRANRADRADYSENADSAGNAKHADTATRANEADTASSATTAQSANTALTAEDSLKLGGIEAIRFAKLSDLDEFMRMDDYADVAGTVREADFARTADTATTATTAQSANSVHWDNIQGKPIIGGGGGEVPADVARTGQENVFTAKQTFQNGLDIVVKGQAKNLEQFLGQLFQLSLDGKLAHIQAINDILGQDSGLTENHSWSDILFFWRRLSASGTEQLNFGELFFKMLEFEKTFWNKGFQDSRLTLEHVKKTLVNPNFYSQATVYDTNYEFNVTKKHVIIAFKDSKGAGNDGYVTIDSLQTTSYSKAVVCRLSQGAYYDPENMFNVTYLSMLKPPKPDYANYSSVELKAKRFLYMYFEKSPGAVRFYLGGQKHTGDIIVIEADGFK